MEYGTPSPSDLQEEREQPLDCRINRQMKLLRICFERARFSNYEPWSRDPTHIKPSARVVWPIHGQQILDGDVGG
jgi:hypothetical protein